MPNDRKYCITPVIRQTIHEEKETPTNNSDNKNIIQIIPIQCIILNSLNAKHGKS